MRAEAGLADCATGSLLTFDAAERRSIFCLKTDPPFRDAQLRALKEVAERELVARVAAIADAAASFGFRGKVETLSGGTYHIAHRIVQPEGSAVVVRSALPNLFAEDRSLELDSWAARWLAAASAGTLVPRTHAILFRAAGAPFDLAILEFARGVLLRDLGDAILDTDPAYLEAIGRVLRQVHGVTGEGAGLVSMAGRTALERPTGVHDRWSDYIALNLRQHVAQCAAAGYVDEALGSRILYLFDAMRPALEHRPMRFLHGDPGNHNIAFDTSARRVSTLLDWEDALVGDPLFEIAMWSSFHPPHRLSHFLKGYGLANPTLAELCLIALYFLRIALSKTVHRTRFAIADRPGREPGHHRIQRGVDELDRLLSRLKT